MKLSPKQAAKRRWKTQRDAKATNIRDLRALFRFKMVKRIQTPFGTLEFYRHPLFQADHES